MVVNVKSLQTSQWTLYRLYYKVGKECNTSPLGITDTYKINRHFICLDPAKKAVFLRYKD